MSYYQSELEQLSHSGGKKFGNELDISSRLGNWKIHFLNKFKICGSINVDGFNTEGAEHQHHPELHICF